MMKMKVADYLVQRLIEYNVTDTFGIPGGVLLDFLYAMEKRTEIDAHLCYHEQAAGFAACGYAQVNHSLGVAYATRGPGFTNLITSIADAYSDSLPVLFITSHANSIAGNGQRFVHEQELDSVAMVKNITKYAKAVDNLSDVQKEIELAINCALSGRKGPVMLDIASSLWQKEINLDYEGCNATKEINLDKAYVIEIFKIINSAYRPILLVGDGVRQSRTKELLELLTAKLSIPIVSSRGGQDVCAGNRYYYGYIGSHGCRYSNMIFAKSDFVLVIGNRMGFPRQSESYQKTLKDKIIYRIDIDDAELKISVNNCTNICVDIKDFVQEACGIEYAVKGFEDWIQVCDVVKESLKRYDVNTTTSELESVINVLPKEVVCVCDVGNNEFWFSRAYENSNKENRVLYSKSYGALGCAIGKAIGAYYRTRKPVLCVVGDQGLQMNVQELQTVAQNNLPITILIVNNRASAMIQDHELQKFDFPLHVTNETGYVSLKLENIARAYGIEYKLLKNDFVKMKESPLLCELLVEEQQNLVPNLPRGKKMHEMSPFIDAMEFDMLEML